MNNLITSLEEIQIELIEIQDFLEKKPNEEIREIEERGNKLIVYLARTSKMLADVKYLRDEKLNSEFVTEMKTILNMSPSVANKYINTICKVENFYINRLTEQRKDLEKAHSWYGQLYARIKKEMEYNYFNSHK